jgi:cell division protein FtsB
MQLFSDWMHILTTRIYDIRRKAFTGGNNVSMITRLARQVRITCNVLAYQEELVKADFTKHPSMAAAYLRHLTVHLGKLSPADSKLSQKLKDEIALSNKALENSVDKNEAEVVKLQKANGELQKTVHRLEDKLNLIIKHHPDLLKAKK